MSQAPSTYLQCSDSRSLLMLHDKLETMTVRIRDDVSSSTLIEHMMPCMLLQPKNARYPQMVLMHFDMSHCQSVRCVLILWVLTLLAVCMVCGYYVDAALGVRS